MDNDDWDALDPARSKLRALSKRVDRGLVELGLDTQAGALATQNAVKRRAVAIAAAFGGASRYLSSRSNQLGRQYAA